MEKSNHNSTPECNYCMPWSCLVMYKWWDRYVDNCLLKILVRKKKQVFVCKETIWVLSNYLEVKLIK